MPAFTEHMRLEENPRIFVAGLVCFCRFAVESIDYRVSFPS